MAAPACKFGEHMMESQKMTKKQVKSVISDIKQQEKLFLGSRENANSLVELLSLRKVQVNNKALFLSSPHTTQHRSTFTNVVSTVVSAH